MTAFNFSLARANGTLLTGITQPGTFDPREKDDTRGDDASLHQSASAVIRSSPMASFSTVAVRTLVGLLTGVEVPFVALDGVNGMELIGLRTNTAGGVGRDTGTVHARRQFLSGALLLDRLSWSPGSVLEAACSAYAISSAGGTSPIVADTIAAPATAVNTERLVLTALNVGGAISASRINSIDLSIGHGVENNDENICFDKGLPFPVLLKQPGMTGATEMTASIETSDLTTSISSSAALSMTFTVVNNLGVGIGATGITVALNNGFARARALSNNRRRIEVRGLWNGTTRPLTLAQF